MEAQKLGLGVAQRPTRIYVEKSQNSYWHLWDTVTEKAIPITESNITGFLSDCYVTEKKTDFGTSKKLHLLINADKVYEVISGLDTWFSKTILLALCEQSPKVFLNPITIELSSTDATKKVIFGRLYVNNSLRAHRSSYDWKLDLNAPEQQRFSPEVAANAMSESLKELLNNQQPSPTIAITDSEKINYFPEIEESIEGTESIPF
jgi:hypothetical protein